MEERDNATEGSLAAGEDSSCHADACCCGPISLDRRQFVRLAGAAGAAAILGPQPLMAGPFEASDFAKLIPPDKKLDPSWVKSLYERGQPTVYRGKDLDTIGMPVGGLCAGLLYLGGDGKLWLWNVMNQEQVGVLGGGSAGHNYVNPVKASSPLEQGFALRIKTPAGAQIRGFDRTGWRDIAFQGQYPIGTVEYRDADSPVSVQLQAYSPFIPLNTEDSSLPATVMSFTVRNETELPLEVVIGGWIQNAVAMYTSEKLPVTRKNEISKSQSLTFLECIAEPVDKTTTPQFDHGSMGIGILAPPTNIQTFADIGDGPVPAAVFAQDVPEGESGDRSGTKDRRIIGALRYPLDLPANGTSTVSFVVAWHFRHVQIKGIEGAETGRYYARKFPDAFAVADYITSNFEKLHADTVLWRDTWYDSTLPHWFLDRTLLNTSILATTTCYRFGTGRFYAWEGVGCCPGTCTHVWSYAQAAGRLFPELERITRETVDYGIAFVPSTGQIDYRAEADRKEATDGQAGTILRTLREHQMCADNAFLQRVWPRAKKAIEFLIRKDKDQDGIIQGAQPNTLDAAWYGEISWISSLYVAALLAGQQMAQEMGDGDFAAQCGHLADEGNRNISNKLFNGRYFIQKADPVKPDIIGSYSTCEIDQVLGQSWAWQVGLDRVLDRKKTLSALRSLWQYNFTPNVGPFREAFPAGRWYAVAGEAGLIMATNPQDIPNPYRASKFWSVGYFDECMTGFEHQVASHMIAEGMVEPGLAVTRAVHDRYHASRRNPWNEIECSDHYSRAMASYGSFVTMCGFEYHGPKGHIGFAPRMSQDDFRAPFVTAEGWGTFSQHGDHRTQSATLQIKWGRLQLRTFSLALPKSHARKSAAALVNKRHIPTTVDFSEGRANVTFSSMLDMNAGDQLDLTIR